MRRVVGGGSAFQTRINNKDTKLALEIALPRSLSGEGIALWGEEAGEEEEDAFSGDEAPGIVLLFLPTQ